MQLTDTILQILVIGTLPFLLMLAEKRSKIVQQIGAVVIAYALGILLGISPWPDWQDKVVDNSLSVSVPLAIIFLLFMTAFKQWLSQAKMFIKAFLLGVVAVTSSVVIAALIWQNTLDEVWKLAGMMTGVYTGGTPNLSVIGRALDVPEETFIALNATDLMLGAVYLLFLFSFAKGFFGLFLMDDSPPLSENQSSIPQQSKITIGKWALNFLPMLFAAVLILVLSVLVSHFYHDRINQPTIFVVISIGAIACSFIPFFRKNPVNKDAGAYFLLVFCFSIGLLTDPNQLYEAGRSLLGFVSLIFLLSICFHFLLSKLFGISRDVFILTSTACLYGPPFIPAVSKSLKREDLIVSGITTALIGFAIANFIGIGIAFGLEWYLEEGVKLIPQK